MVRTQHFHGDKVVTPVTHEFDWEHVDGVHNVYPGGGSCDGKR